MLLLTVLTDNRAAAKCSEKEHRQSMQYSVITRHPNVHAAGGQWNAPVDPGMYSFPPALGHLYQSMRFVSWL